MPDRVQTPALIQRLVSIEAPPFFYMEYATRERPAKDRPSDWSRQRKDAHIQDHPEADQQAAALGFGYFAAVATTATQIAERTPAIVRRRAIDHDWRTQAANCGIE